MLALVAMGVLAGTFTFESLGLAAAVERLTEATRQSNELALRRPPPPVRASASALPPPPPPPDPSPPLARAMPYPSAIVRESDTEFLVDRHLVDLVLEEQASLVRSVRVVPVFTNGRTYPKLLGVRPDSLLGMLGFRDGDCLESMNGFDLSTPERALEAYAHLRTADILEARVRRAGQSVTLVYRIW